MYYATFGPYDYRGQSFPSGKLATDDLREDEGGCLYDLSLTHLPISNGGDATEHASVPARSPLGA